MNACEQCGGEHGPEAVLGILGHLRHYRCRYCGWVQSVRIDPHTTDRDHDVGQDARATGPDPFRRYTGD